MQYPLAPAPHASLLRLVSIALCCVMLLPNVTLSIPAMGTTTGGVHKTPAPLAPSRSTKRQTEARGGELLVRFREGVTAEEANALLESKGVRRGGRLRGRSGVEKLSVGDGRDVTVTAAELRSSALVEFAEPNFTITADQVSPNDPRFPEQWALRNTGQRGGPTGTDIGATTAWQQTTGTPKTIIAVIDSGIDISHADLRANVWTNPKEQLDGRDEDGDGYADDLRGWDWVSNSNEVRDEYGHGTAMAGVIAAEGDNAAGLTGVMWRAGLMSLRVLDSSGKGTVADAIEAIDYAVTHGAQVINCSWGLDEPSEALRDAIARAGQSGALVVIAAGNGGRNLDESHRYPASLKIPAALSVGSTTTSDELTSWSNWGTNSVQVVAPGEAVLTTKAGGGYEEASGSSVSAATVSGVAGLVRTLRPRLSAARTREMIIKGVRRVASLSDRVSSSGVVSAAGAIESLSTLPPGEGDEQGDGEDGKDDGKQVKGYTSAGDGFAINSAASAPPPVLGVPDSNLPNLDAIRQLQPAAPQAPPPVPSTRCAPSNPNCVLGGSAFVRSPFPDYEQFLTKELAWTAGPLPDFLHRFERREVSDLAFSPLALAGSNNSAASVAGQPSDAVQMNISADAPSVIAGAVNNLGEFLTPNVANILTPLQGDLLAHWKFDDSFGTTAADSSLYGNAGTVSGAAWGEGRVGGALAFDGVDDLVAVNSNASLNDLRDTFTVAFWAFPLSSHEIDSESTGGYGGTSGQRYAFDPRYVGGSDSGAGVSVGTNGVSVYEHAYGYMPATLVYQSPISGWTHVAVVYQNKQPSLYVNGVLVRTGLTSPRASVHLFPSAIGGMAYGYFHGGVDGVRVYNRALSETEVQALIPSTPTALLADDFDDNVRDTAKWNFLGGTNSVTVLEQNRRLEVTPSSATSEYNGYQAVNNMDLTNARAMVEVAQATSTSNPYAETNFGLWGGGGGLVFVKSGSSLCFRLYQGGMTQSCVTYSAADHRFWRLRHDQASDQLLWETSKNAMVWTAGRSIARPWALTSENVNLYAGSWAVAANPGTAFFDNLKIDLPDPNTPPTVSVTAPQNNAVFENGSNITITASASDTDGTVSKVEFFQGATKLGEDTTQPYSHTWADVPAGNYAVTAKATDDDVVTTTSGGVNITVSLPTVSVTATDAVASEAAGDPGAFTVSRTGSITSPLTVGFSISGTASNGTDYAGTGLSVTIPAGSATANVAVLPVDDALVEGNETAVFTLSTSAGYNVGSPAGATVTIADNDTHPPTVSITTPAGGTVFNAPANITITAAASDADGSVSKVEFFKDGVKLGEDATAPYSFSWNNVAAGSYNLTAVATDNAGATGTSPTVSVTVNALPAVSVTGPAGGSVFTAPASITITADASDADGSVSKVEFFQGSTKLGEDTASPYTLTWSGVTASGYTLTAKATDNRGALVASSPVNITVNGAPAVNLTAPAEGTVYTAPAAVIISAAASDADGTVSKVEFYHGGTLIGEDTTSPYSIDWSWVGAGSYTLTARAVDNLGAATTSATLNIIVNSPPSVSITGPANNAAFAAGIGVTISANASDADGSIAKVEFFQGATKLGEDTTSPYSFPWSSVPAGSHTLTAKATDDRGATTTSAAVVVSAVDFTPARLDAVNRTGSSDLFSRNFNWGVSLVSLPGRAGLDLDLALSYNSLVWTKSQADSAIMFDGDRGFPSPGFRFGFPVIQGPYQRTLGTSSVNVYVLLTPSGGRVELRQQGASNVYESTDSSYLRLEDNGGTLTLRPAGGSRMNFALMAGGEYQCTEVKDADGNYLTAAYTAFGRLESVTDTLGRVVTVHYDSYQNPIKVTQVWTVDGQQQEHVWATFGYENRTVSTAFGDLAVAGAEAGRLIPVLTQVGLNNGTRYNFTYNEWGQVGRITRSAQDTAGQWVQISYVEYTLPGDGADCPRFTESKVWARDWNKMNGVEEPVTTAFSTEGEMQVVTLPDGTQEKVRYATSGFRRGLVIGTETWGTEEGVHAKRKWTETSWQQDDESLVYPSNPRVEEMSVSDGPNTRRTVIDYLTVAESAFRLPKKASEYEGASTLLRYTETDYLPASVQSGSEYASLRIIGLVSESRLYDAVGQLQSRVSYLYDTEGCVESAGAPVRHDGTYGVAAKRGLVCSVRRHNVGVVDADNPALVESRGFYNTAGAILYTLDPLGHKNSINYADKFSDGVSRNTYAYPTATTDADQNVLPEAQRKSSSITYNFDTGMGTLLRDVKGAEQVMLYDSAGRLSRATRRDGVNNVDAGYVRYIYSPVQDYVQTFTQLDPGVEAYSVQVFDGAGRVRAAAGLHPGSTGGYSGQHFVYDRMGRTVKQSNPAEINGAWSATGEDQAGWLYGEQSFDWKGRPRVTTNTDGTTREATYEGCGCSGGEVVTLKGEVLPEGRRQQKVYHDIFGRVAKTEMMDWYGSVYSTVTNTYNVRNQLTEVKHQAGISGTAQVTVIEYDGHGRAWRTHRPEMDANTWTVTNYNADDTVRSVVDGRGVTTAFAYNNRHLVTGIDYTPTGTITDTPSVTYDYDVAGNRTSMTDGAGSTTYHYDVLSRMDWEERQFVGLSDTYRLSYIYNLAGALKKVTDPTNVSIDYGYDPAGRLTGVTGATYANVSTYASNFQYRAFGAPKSFTHGSGQGYQMGYDARLRLEGLQAGILMSAEFRYYDDGKLRYAKDNLDPKMDRAYSYDHAGHLSEGLSGGEARDFVNNTHGSEADGIYRQTYQYDVWGNLKGRAVNRFWSGGRPFTTTYVNNRQQGSYYDADGRVTFDRSDRTHTYDASGRQIKTSETSRRSSWALNPVEGEGTEPSSPEGGYYTTTVLTIQLSHDGDGRSTKRTRTTTMSTPFYQPVTVEQVEYYVRSSVLGGKVITELSSAGQKQTTKVYSGEAVVAEQKLHAEGQQEIIWQHTNPVTGTKVEQQHVGGWVLSKAEYDPWGLELGDSDPHLESAEPDYASLAGGSFYREGGNPFDADHGCQWNGEPIKCESRSFIYRTQQVVGTQVRTQGHEGGGFGMEMGLTRVWHNGGVNSQVFDEDGKPMGPASAVSPDRGFYWVMTGGVTFQRDYPYRIIPGDNFTFNKRQIEILQEVEKRIAQDDCRRWFETTMTELLDLQHAGKLRADDLLKGKSFQGPHSLANLMSHARFSEWSPNLDQGLSTDGMNKMKNEGKPAVIVERGGLRNILLHDNIFQRHSTFGGGIDVDTAGHIIHELFHVAGFSDELFHRLKKEGRDLQAEIHANCGLPGTRIDAYVR